MKKQILPKIKKTLQDKEINTKQLKITSLIILVIALILIVGGTLATFNFEASLLGGDIKVNKCKLIINIKGNNPITLLEAYPISDDKIKEYQPYTFTVTNKSTCKNAYYRITLGDICATCTDVTCDVNGQSLNCDDANQISPHKINYQLINKKTNEKTNYFNPNTLEAIGSLAKGESIDFELKLWLDHTASEEALYVYENGKPKENSDGSIVTKNVGYKVNVESQGWEVTKEKQSEIPVTPQDKSGANVPVLTSNMIPVFYDETSGVWRKADTTIKDEENPWYDYDQKKWANAVILDGGYSAAEINSFEEVPVDIAVAWFVWIPRYKYTYFSNRDPVEIPITFEKGRQSTGTIKCRDTIPTSGGIKEICTDTTYGSLIPGESTYTHPAFTFGDEELTGIWIGKFETSEYDKARIVPGAIPTSDVAMNKAFEFTRFLDSFSSSYYFPQTSENFNALTGEIIRDSNNLDPHIMKNMEWGAVAYLSHSKYGTCTDGFCEEVGVNNYKSTDNQYMTGCGAETGSPISDVCNEYDTSEGMLASTTRNIYGIYDMSGGLEEAVMANVQENGDFYYGDNTWSETEKPLNKYYEKYDFSAEDWTEWFKLGDATKELQYTFIENSSGGGYSTTWYDGEFGPGNPGWIIRGSGLFADLPFKGIFGICSYEMLGSGYRIALAVYSHRENIE